MIFPSISRRLRAGFTMIEVLLVVAMIGVMVAIVGPKFRLSESTEVQLAGMQLVQDMELARTRALATRAEVRFVFETETGAYGGYLDHDGDGTIGESAEERTALRGFGRRELPARVRFGRGSAEPLPTDGNGNAVTFADDRVNFNTRGITEPLGTSGVVYLTHSTDEAQVTAVSVSGSGAMRFWTWRNGKWH